MTTQINQLSVNQKYVISFYNDKGIFIFSETRKFKSLLEIKEAQSFIEGKNVKIQKLQ